MALTRRREVVGAGRDMFSFLRSNPRKVVIDRLHAAVVERARRPALYGPGGLPDTFEGRFEALTLHVLVVLRRLRALPPPADEVAQELVDSVFAHLEVAMRETGVGDMGVPKKMKKLGQAFYDRTARYDAALEAGDEAALTAEIERRLGRPGEGAGAAFAAHLLSEARALADQDLASILGSSDPVGPRRERP